MKTRVLLTLSLALAGTTQAGPLGNLLAFNRSLSTPDLHNVHHALATAAYVDYYDVQGAMVEKLGKWYEVIFDADKEDRKEIDRTLRRLCINPKEIKVLFSTTPKIHHCCTPKRIFLYEQDYDMLGTAEKEFLLAHMIEHIKHESLARKVMHRTIISLGVDLAARGLSAAIPKAPLAGGVLKNVTFEVLDTCSYLLSSKWVQLGLGHRLCSITTAVDEERFDREAAENLQSAEGGIRLCGKHRAPRPTPQAWQDRVGTFLMKALLPTQCWTCETDFSRMQRLWELESSFEEA